MTSKSNVCSILDCCEPNFCRGSCGAHYMRFRKHGDPLGGGTSRGAPMRFIHEVALHHTGDECLIWPFSKAGGGYGKVWNGIKIVIASRYICELVHGAPPTPEHDAAHSCGKGHEGCIAPGHLGWKTKSENQADRFVHGTHNRGERQWNAKLAEADVREIIFLRGTESQRKLAKRFDVSQSLIGDIHTGRKWAWLSEEVVINVAR